MSDLVERLLPCPFCGGEAKIHQVGNEHTPKRGFEVKCRTWNCVTKKRALVIHQPLEKAREFAITAWNRRPPAECVRLRAENGRLVAEMEAARYAPLGDNHHNAASCPYCNPSFLSGHDRAEVAEKRITELEGERDRLTMERDDALFIVAVHAAPCQIDGCQFTKLIGERDTATRALAEMRAALTLHGRHRQGCATGRLVDKWKPCDCGLAAALGGFDAALSKTEGKG